MSWPNLPAEMWPSKVCAIQSETNPLVLCSNAVDRSRFGFPKGAQGEIEPLLLMFGRYVTGSCFADSSRILQRNKVKRGRQGTSLLSRACLSVNRSEEACVLLPPRGQTEPACQVKNANELFKHMLHMISVAWECAKAASGDNKKLSLWWRIASLSFPVEQCSFFIIQRKGKHFCQLLWFRKTSLKFVILCICLNTVRRLS